MLTMTMTTNDYDNNGQLHKQLYFFDIDIQRIPFFHPFKSFSQYLVDTMEMSLQ